MVAWIPKGHLGLTAHLVVSDGARAIRFYHRALAASEIHRFCTWQGKIVHAELQIGNCRIMLSEESPDADLRSPRAHGGCPTTLQVYVEDVELMGHHFLAAGGFIVNAITLQVHGDRSGEFRDPEGYHWILAQRVEAVAIEEIGLRLASTGITLSRPGTDEVQKTIA